MKTLKILALAGLLGAAGVAQAAPQTYQLDPSHTMVLFSWSHFGFSHPSANLALGEGTLVFDEAHPEQASVKAVLPLAGLDTHVEALTEHLKKADFLDAGQFPSVTFESTRVVPEGEGRFKVVGNLSIHGVTRPVTLDATLNRIGPHPMSKAQSIGFDATGSIKRSDFGVAGYVPNVGDELTIRITTEGSVAP